MKKIYQQPAIVEMSMDENKPIAASLTIDNEAHEGLTGDVKADGNWDIWCDEEAEE